MNKNVRRVFLFLIISGLLGIVACDKNESGEETQKTNADKIIGTWQTVNENYEGTITFEAGSRLVYDYFMEDSTAGVGWYDWTIVDDQLTMTFISGQGDYNDYNEISTGGIIDATIEITDSELIINHMGESYVYTKLSSDMIIDESELVGSWQFTDGDYRSVITFIENANLADNLGTESFVAASDSGAANFSWNINGNMIFANYYFGHLYGDFASYNETNPYDLVMAKVSVIDNQLIFYQDGEEQVFSRVTEDRTVSKEDLLGTWINAEGTSTEILRLEILNKGGSGTATHSFVNETASGATTWNYWTVSGDLFTIEYQGELLGDYASYHEISRHSSQTISVSYANDQLTFTTNDGDFSFSRMDESEIISESEIIGTWEITDETYSGEITFNEDSESIDSFTDESKSGIANFTWWINGKIITIQYHSMTGDYESYNNVSNYGSTTAVISLSGNQLTFTADGTDYVYSKKAE